MAALDARHVDEARRAAEQRAAGKHQLRNRLPAALGDRTRAVRDALAALERVADRRVRLEPLELVVGRQIGIGIVEVDDEPDRNEVLAIVVEERAAAGRVVERPAERVLHEPALVLVRRHLPQLLEADAELLRIAPLRQLVALDQPLGQRAARALPRTACTCPAAPCRARSCPSAGRPCRSPMSPVATPTTRPWSS